MDFRLQYTQRALNDFATLIDYLAGSDAEAAARFGTSLLDHLDLLARFPRMGSAIPKRSHVRKLLHSPILVYYRINEAKRRIDVLHLRHASRRPSRFFE